MNAVNFQKLPAYAVFAALLASAGLPIYIHAPKYYVDEYGVSLAALGGTLFILRLFDVVQDPFFGWLSETLRNKRSYAVFAGSVLMAVSMFGLFAVSPLLVTCFVARCSVVRSVVSLSLSVSLRLRSYVYLCVIMLVCRLCVCLYVSLLCLPFV